MMNFLEFLAEEAKKPKKPKPPKPRPKKNLWFNNPDFWREDLRMEKGDAVKYHEDEEQNIYATDLDDNQCYGFWDKKKFGGMTFFKPRPFQHYAHRKQMKSLSEGDVIPGKFEQRLRTKKGMYKNPDIEVPPGYARFEVERTGKSGNIGRIVGVREDGTRRHISTSTYELANALAAAYNAGGYTDKDIRKVPLSDFLK